MKTLKDFCNWHQLPYPTTQDQADKVFSELDFYLADENIMEDGELSVEEGREKLDWLYQAWYNEFGSIPDSWII